MTLHVQCYTETLNILRVSWYNPYPSSTHSLLSAENTMEGKPSPLVRSKNAWAGMHQSLPNLIIILKALSWRVNEVTLPK